MRNESDSLQSAIKRHCDRIQRSKVERFFEQHSNAPKAEGNAERFVIHLPEPYAAKIKELAGLTKETPEEYLSNIVSRSLHETVVEDIRAQLAGLSEGDVANILATLHGDFPT